MVRTIFIDVPRDVFWKRYWSFVGKDTNNLKDSEYPLHLINKHLKKNMRILEAGCGMGRVLKHYHFRGFDIHGLEYDKNCVLKLEKEDNELKLIQGSITKLPYKTNSFDVVMAYGVLGHLENDMDEAFNEVNRVIKNGGLLAASLCYDNIGRSIFRLREYMKKRFNPRKERHFYTRLFSKPEIIQTLKSFGFELLELEPVFSRGTVYDFFPFCRHNVVKSHELVRTSDKNYPLNFLGELAYNFVNRFFPWDFAYATSFVAIKRGDVSG